jgi:CheY-like chemotaxis protein
MRELLRRTMREDIEITASHAEGLLPALVDPPQLESAILNLALNAQDAMTQGGHLTITTADAVLDERYRDEHPEVKPGDYVMVAVTDDGCGMTPDILERVFEPFFTTKEVGRGSGLGLSMVYGFVKQSNGHVAIYSEPGLGTTVRLYLPTARQKPEEGTTSQSGRNANPKRGSETVLVVEDDNFVRGYAVACLESLGYTVITAADGRSALERLNNGDIPDILFTDIVMPGGVSGLDLAEQARAIKPDLRVLFASGYPLETLAARGKLSAAAAILNKPYRKAELALRIREALDAMH